jgi:hypothetical protein
MLSGVKPPFPTCEFSDLVRLRVDGVVLQSNESELIWLYAVPECDKWLTERRSLSANRTAGPKRQL